MKVLLVGWSGADWESITPLLDGGAMPCLDRLIERGVMGRLSSPAPLVPPLLWTSLATGKRADKHGVLNWTEPDPLLGVLRPVGSRARRCAALWNILDHQGLKSHVVNGYATHPAEPIRGVFVSDRFAPAVGPGGEPWPVEIGAIHPQRVESALSELRVHPGDLYGEHLLPFVPRLEEIDQERDPRVAAVAAILAETVTVHAAATWILENEPWDFLAVHYRGLEQFCQGFLRYQPPCLPDVPERDFERYREVVDAGYRFHDRMLARLLDLAGPDATVVLVSEHGFRTGDSRPQAACPPAQWHRGSGILCMAGPPLKQDELIHQAGILDVAPTILTLFGLPVGEDMDGRPLLAAWRAPAPPDRLSSWDAVLDRQPPPPTPETSPALTEAMAALDAQGYRDVLGQSQSQSHLGRVSEQYGDYHLALVHLDAGRPAQALPALQRLHEAAPENGVVTLYLAYGHYLLGAYDRSRRLVAALDEADEDHPLKELLLAMIGLAERQPEQVIERLLNARRTRRREPVIFYLIGRAFLQLRRFAEAEQAFGDALSLDKDCIGAHFGRALGFLQQARWGEAADAALSVVGLNHHHGEGHYVLGVALARMQRPKRAIQAFEMALSVRPRLTAARRWLDTLHAKNDPLRGTHRRALAEVEPPFDRV